MSEVKEEEVMKDAIGGNGLSAAYCLIYIDNSLIPKIPKGLLRSYTLSSNTELVTDHYKSLISNELKSEVELDNKNFAEELVEFRIGNIVRKVQDFYLMRQSQTYSQFLGFKNSKNRKETTKFELINLAVHLRIKGDELLSRWVILDISVRDNTPDQRGLEQLDESEMLYQKIKKQYRSMREAPSWLDLDNEYQESLAREKLLFENNYKDAMIAVFLMENIMSENFDDVVYAINWKLKTDKNNESEYQIRIHYVLEILVIRLSSFVFSCLETNQIENAIKYSKLLAFLAENYIENSSVLQLQMTERLISAYTYAKENLTGSLTADHDKEFISVIQALKNHNSFNPMIEDNPPKNFKDFIETFDKLNCYSWIEGWKKEEVANTYIPTITKFEYNLQNWVQIHQKIKNSQELIPEDEFRQIDSSSKPKSN